MDRRDYIMRLIEQVGQALIALRRRILAREATATETREELRAAARAGGLDFDLARAMTSETLMMMVAPGGEVDPGRCWLLAEMFYLEGVEAELTGRVVEARDSLQRAAFLFGMLQPIAGNLVGLPEATPRIEEIERRLTGLPRARRRIVTTLAARAIFRR
jgi:hypothetical protein